ncbi:hypothetical protein, variant 1 [Aphanomyces invadans]|uniref:Inositol oxygenase n=1 Tax=Aphanomyces invadans TaxID=157072 RepID=A0A024TJU0_9STRA|nr:hypothetical protein, variant 1 [Aphanomyces invadans]ETV94269.1 hypothetical protein, variant 1 [Aphanomyces invadans]|eukprot:XP_008877030.1 hypothetical protein, variant 1 [Aphanomyces invadans]
MTDPSCGELSTRRCRSGSIGEKVDVREVLNGSVSFRLQFMEDTRAKELKWVLFTEGRRGAVGKLIFTLEAGNSAHIKVIDIHPNYRRLGLSKVLFLACMATLKQRNIHELCLEAEEDTRRHRKLVSLYEEWGFSVKQNAKILFLYNDTESFRKVPMALSLSAKPFVPLEPTCNQSFCMISLRTVDGMFVVATEDGMIDTTKGASRDVFWQSLLLDDGATDANPAEATGSGKGSTICLRSAYGKFLCVEPVGTVLADRFVNSTWETFDVLPHPTGGGVSLRSFHGNFLGLDPSNGGLAISQDPVAWDGDAINLMCNKANPTPLHVKIMRKHQTMAFALAQRKRLVDPLHHGSMTLVEACQTLMQLIGESTRQVSGSKVLASMVHDADVVRRNGHPDWLQLATFLRGLGMLFLLWTDDDAMPLRGISYDQWLRHTDTWVLGRPIPESIAHANLNDLNTDNSTHRPPTEGQRGMAHVNMPWTPDEYLYHVLEGNHTTLPREAADVIRYFSCRVWYVHDAYPDVESAADLAVKELVRLVAS